MSRDGEEKHEVERSEQKHSNHQGQEHDNMQHIIFNEVLLRQMSRLSMMQKGQKATVCVVFAEERNNKISHRVH